MQKSLVVFSGTFDKNVRMKFRERRLHLGLSYQQLSTYLDVNWSTIKKWENGGIDHCNRRRIEKIRKFLNGELDAIFLEEKEENMNLRRFWGSLSPQMSLCMERIITTGVLCQVSPEIGGLLTKRINQAAATAVRELLGDARRNNSKMRSSANGY